VKAKYVYACSVDYKEAYKRVLCEKLWGVSQEDNVDGRLLLAFKSLYSWSKGSVRVCGVQSQP